MESQGTFIDLGSGHGGLVCMLAALRRFRACFGVENEPLRASYAHPLAQRFLQNVQQLNLQHSLVQINFGNFLKCETTKTFLKTASLIWINNVKFTFINYEILQLLDQYVPIGCVVVSFVSLFSSRGNDSGFVQIYDDSVVRAGDWTKTAQTVYVIQKREKSLK
jgi:predicted RNA methylase